MYMYMQVFPEITRASMDISQATKFTIISSKFLSVEYHYPNS